MDEGGVFAVMDPDLMGSEDHVVRAVGMLDRQTGFDRAVVVNGLGLVVVRVAGREVDDEADGHEEKQNEEDYDKAVLRLHVSFVFCSVKIPDSNGRPKQIREYRKPATVSGKVHRISGSAPLDLADVIRNAVASAHRAYDPMGGFSEA
jgi:hypothetical protein